MAYQKTIWEGREGDGLDNYIKFDETPDSVTLINSPRTITRPGTEISPQNLNHIEDGIEAAHNLIATETQQRTEADQSFQSALETEIRERTEAEQNLQSALETETHARTETDQNLQEQINTLQSINDMPDGASFTQLFATKQDKIAATGSANVLTAPEEPGGQPGTKPLADFVDSSALDAKIGSRKGAWVLPAEDIIVTGQVSGWYRIASFNTSEMPLCGTLSTILLRSGEKGIGTATTALITVALSNNYNAEVNVLACSHLLGPSGYSVPRVRVIYNNTYPLAGQIAYLEVYIIRTNPNPCDKTLTCLRNELQLEMEVVGDYCEPAEDITIGFVPAGYASVVKQLVPNEVADAIALRAPIASPTFTGSPKVQTSGNQGTFANKLAVVAETSVAAETSLPVGSYILVDVGESAPNINAQVYPRAGFLTQYSYSGGIALSGVWRSCGSRSVNSYPVNQGVNYIYVTVCRRVS